MSAFTRLMRVALISGATAGLVLFLLQISFVVPLIATAETLEHASEEESGHHEAEAWQPAEGFERTAYTAAGTILVGIALAAITFGAASALHLGLDAQRGLLLGLAGFACFALAPALGLPPKPPGAGAPELLPAQIWWLSTAFATALGLWLIAGGRHSWLKGAAGIALLVAPHLVGAPATPDNHVVPTALAQRFAVISIATQGVFWLVMTSLGGHLYGKEQPTHF